MAEHKTAAKTSATRCAHPCASVRGLMKVGMPSAAVAAVLAMSLAPPSSADATATLKSEVDSAHGKCPALQPDPVLDGLAQRATSETQAYIEHTARFIPIEDPMPALHALGFSAGKAKLLSGYGDAEAKAIHGVMTQGWEALSDCTYTKYGINVFENADRGYVLAAVILTGN